MNILETKADFILLPCNSVTVKPRGLAREICSRYPHARVYRHRKPVFGKDLAIESDRAIPGSVVICNCQKSPSIISIYNQYLPGKIESEEFSLYSSWLPKVEETQTKRHEWFIEGMEKLCHYLHNEYKGRPHLIAVPKELDEKDKEILYDYQGEFPQQMVFVFY